MQEIYRVHLASPKHSEALRLGFAYHVTVVEFFFFQFVNLKLHLLVFTFGPRDFAISANPASTDLDPDNEN